MPASLRPAQRLEFKGLTFINYSLIPLTRKRACHHYIHPHTMKLAIKVDRNTTVVKKKSVWHSSVHPSWLPYLVYVSTGGPHNTKAMKFLMPETKEVLVI